MMDYPDADPILNEIKRVVSELKNQVAAEEAKLNQLESLLPIGIGYNDANDYSYPAWFDLK